MSLLLVVATAIDPLPTAVRSCLVMFAFYFDSLISLDRRMTVRNMGER